MIQLGQVSVQGSAELAPFPSGDVSPSLPDLSGWRTLPAPSPQEIVRTGPGLLHIFEGPHVRLAASRRYRIRECPEESDSRLAGPIVLRPRAGRPEVNDAGASQERSAGTTDEAAAVVGLEDEGRTMSPEQPIKRDCDVPCSPMGQGDPGDRVPRCEISDGEDDSPPTVYRCRRFSEVDGPHRTGLEPRELV
jgi:hypothetical protein